MIIKLNTSTEEGRKAVKELQTKKFAKIEYPLSEAIAGQKGRSFVEVYEEGLDRLSEFYGVDMRKI